MSDIKIGQGAIPDALRIDNKQAKETKSSDELGQGEFMKLMIAQLNNQDPLQPQENGEFISQLAEFSSLDGIESLNQKLDGLVSTMQSSQALQASALVGREVQVESDRSMLTDKGSISGTLNLEDSADNVQINVYSQSGELVRRLDLGILPGGETEFVWDGRDAGGAQLPQGLYRFSAEGLQGGETASFTTQLSANVDSVTLGQGSNEMTLNLAGLGKFSLADIKQFS